MKWGLVMINRCKLLLITISIFQLFGCANSTLVYHKTDFSSQEIDIISVLPLLDARRRAFSEDNYSEETEEIQSIIVEELEDKDYTVKVVSKSDFRENINPTQIPFMNADQIRKIDLVDTSWLLLPTVTGLQTFTGTLLGYGETVFYLFEKRSGKLVWEGSSIDGDLDDAIEDLIDEFPDK